MVETRYFKNNGIWITESQLESRKSTSLEKYGCEDPNSSELVKLHKKQAFIEHYGVDHFWKSTESKAHMLKINEQRKIKEFETKRRNNSFKSSKAEQRCLIALQSKFGVENVLTQHFSKKYPFRVDFFIKNLELFIELNAFWMHGGKFFDPTNSGDLEVLENWKAKAETNNGYKQAIETWTIRDLKKSEIAIANQLHYLVFWSEKELVKWVDAIEITST